MAHNHHVSPTLRPALSEAANPSDLYAAPAGTDILRRQCYRVRTRIEQGAGLPVVRKVADHPDAEPFLEKILER